MTSTFTLNKEIRVQLLTYMMILPFSRLDTQGKVIGGRLVYKNYPLDVLEPEAVDTDFIQLFRETIERVKASTPGRKIPSYRECRYCDISEMDCPERVDKEPEAISGEEHGLF